MKLKIIFCLTPILTSLLSGCVSAKFKVMPDEDRLTATHPIVAQITCLKSTPKYYTTFRDRNLRVLAVSSPHVRWSAAFQVNQVLKGNFSGQTFLLVNAKDAKTSYSRFVFKTDESYTVGFNRVVNGEVKNLAVLGKEPVFPYGAADK